MSNTAQLSAPEPATALGALEQSHWAVAKAAIELAEAAERLLSANPLKDIFPTAEESRLKRALISFREAAARPA